MAAPYPHGFFRLHVVETTRQDLRQAIRRLRAEPGFAAIVVATIALGLGVNAALITVFNHYVLRPFPVRDPYSLYAVAWVDRAGGRHGLGWGDFQQLRSDRSTFTDLAATRSLYSRLDGRPMVGDLVTGNYFQMLGVGAARGRILGPADDTASNAPDVVVLSDAAWRDAFGGDPAILGRQVRLRGRSLEVVGVAQPGFDGLGDTPVQYWAPIAASRTLEPRADVFSEAHHGALRLVGRLRRDLAPAAAAEALTARVRQATAALAPEARATAAIVESKATPVRVSREMAVVFAPLIAAFVLVLGLACANVANMLLARGLARQREIGIRLSIGAGRARVVRQLLTESVVLGGLAALVSLGLAKLLLDAAIHVMFATLPADIAPLIHTVPIAVDLRVAGVMVAAGLFAATLFGLAPALQSTRLGVSLMVRGEVASGIPAARLRTLLAAGQVTLCVLLVTCAGVLLRSAAAITRIDLGFEPAHVVVVRLDGGARAAAVRALASKPGVTHVAAARSTPMNGLLPGVALSPADGGSAIRSWSNGVSPGFFDLLHVPLVEGRTFSEDEARNGSPVAVLSAAAAKRLWPGKAAVGRLVHVQRDPAPRQVDRPLETLRVIGVARDIVSCCVTRGKDPAVVYVPVTPLTPGASLMLGVAGDAGRIRQDVEAELDRAAPGAIDELVPLDQYVAGGVYPFRAASWIITALAALALLLTISGIFGVLSYVVSQRTQELGIRIAVGATASAIARLVIGQSLRVSALGIAAGGALIAGAVWLIGLQIPFLDLLDVPVYAATLGTVLITALGAAAVPAWRAMRVDPAQSLRRE